MPCELIITDLDGCISPDGSEPWDLDLFGEFARRVRDAVAGRNSLAPLTICTGRPQPYVETLMKQLDIRVPAVCENGAVLYSLPDNLARFGPGVTEEKILGLRAVRAFIETDILPKYPTAVMQFGKEAQVSVFSEKPAIFPELKALVEDFAANSGAPELVINNSPLYLNISLAGVDKGSTLRALLAELGVASEQTAGIGDSEGDLPLRDAVGFFACPSNAQPCVKEAADYVSPFPELKGMLDILQRPECQRAV